MHAERIPPDFDLDSLSPAAGWQTEEKITVTGDFTDDRGFRKIEYRIRGKNNGWKKISFVTDGSAASGNVTATFTLNLKLQRERYTRIEIRAIDVDGIESDYISRRYRWDRYGFVVREETTTNTDTGTDTGTDTNIDTGTGTGTGTGDRQDDTEDSGIIKEFSISPAGAFEPTQVQLTWNVPGAASVVIDQGVGEVANSGTLDLGVLDTTTTFTITATANDGTKSTLSRTVLIQDNPFPF